MSVRRVVVASAAVVVVAAAAYALPAGAATGSSDVWAWGLGTSGQLGAGTILPTGGNATPTRVHLPDGVHLSDASVSSSFAVGVDQNGAAWAWGDDGYGDLGIGGGVPATPMPTRVRLPSGVQLATISAGQSFVLATDNHGGLWGWGANGNGQLGDGAALAGGSPVPVHVPLPNGVRFVQVAAGHSSFGLGLDQHGDAWGWGDNSVGQLGTGDTTARLVPTRVVMPAGVRFTWIGAGGVGGPGDGARGVALDATGRVWSWGDNGIGDLGDGTTRNRSTPVVAALPAGVRIRTVTAGGDFTMAIDSTGQVWGWGAGDALATNNALTHRPPAAGPVRPSRQRRQ